MQNNHKEQRKHSRISLAADLAEPLEIVIGENSRIPATRRIEGKLRTFPAILANISAGGMALITFGGKEVFSKLKKIQLIANLPGMAHATINGQIMHIRSRYEMHTLGVRFLNLAKSVRSRIKKIVADFDDCETRIELGIPEVCIGHTCHFFGLCKKIQKSELTT